MSEIADSELESGIGVNKSWLIDIAADILAYGKIWVKNKLIDNF